MTYTIESAMAALAAGEATIQSIAAETGWPIVDECLVPEPGVWHADDGNAEITYDLEPGTVARDYHETRVGSGEEAAQSYVDTGDWGDDRDTTIWVTVHAWREGIDQEGDSCRVDKCRHTIDLDPEEPECTSPDGHDWQSPDGIVGPIRGHGGGVIIPEVCLRCGCAKSTDTWAQNPDNGEQGLTSISYQPGKYADKIEQLNAAEVREFVASYSDDDEIPAEELERVFRLAYGRAADDEDRETGLWSLICAAEPGQV